MNLSILLADDAAEDMVAKRPRTDGTITMHLKYQRRDFQTKWPKDHLIKYSQMQGLPAPEFTTTAADGNRFYLSQCTFVVLKKFNT